MPTDSMHTPGRWSLAELAPGFDKEHIDTLLAALESATARIEGMRGTLRPDISWPEFAGLLDAIQACARAGARLGALAGLRFSEDTQDPAALALLGRAEQAGADARNRVLFFDLWFRALDNENTERLIAASGGLAYYLRRERMMSRHTLTEPEEKVVNIKDVNGSDALNTIYDIITNKFEFTATIDGETRRMNREELSAHVRHPDPATREAVYRELYRVYGSEATVLGQIYTNRVGDWHAENVGLRKFTSPISVRNLANDIPDTVVDTLLGVCRDRADVFRRYFELKAGWLGMDRLRRFDLYAPLGMTSDRKVEYAEAVRMVMDGFKRFSPVFESEARRVFSDNHIDSEVRHGKRGGAFCYSVTPELAPWVLVNYTGEPRQVATIAHELGHAVHSLLARDHSVLTFHSALPLAETASVFSEMLLTDYLLEAEPDPKLRRDILAKTVDDMYATVLRQAFFVLFERDAHERAVAGATVDELHALYLDNLRAQFGPAVDVDDIFRYEWTSIPHIYHTPFYCYAYSFGMLLSLSLYSRYKREGAGFVPDFLKILTFGGSASPAEILVSVGIDMASAAFWNGGFDVIEETIGKLGE